MADHNDTIRLQSFLSVFRPRALAQGITSGTFDRCLKGVKPLPDVLKRMDAQAEFTLSLRDYMDRVATSKRVTDGRTELRKRRPLFMRIEAEFGVEAEPVLAIWGVETNFGRQRGKVRTLAALATLAASGRRRAAFFESELLAALNLVQSGQVTPKLMLGSWAGAMGHGQFMPSSVLAYAVDHDGDGRADIWHKDPEDGLASIANYLAKHGWRRGQNCVIRVTVPDGFDHSLTGLDQSAPANTWQDRGITMPDGTPPVDYGKASLIQPAGHKGPALLAFNNFRTLLRYNNAVFYALAVSTLASQISGSKALRIDWPNDRPLTRTEIKALQSGLSGAGYDAGSPDGLMGPDTLRAIRAYQIARNLPADGFPSKDLLVHLARNTLGSARG